MGMSQTIIVSNRLPVSIKKGEKGLEVYPSAGGLATGLSSYASKKGNLWIGWPGVVSDDLSDSDRREIIKKLATYNCSPVFLTKKQLDDFYSGFSNSVLWPFLHTLEPDFSSEKKQWRAYHEVNQLFCEAVVTASQPSADIWVHDYQLLLLPKLLREFRPNNNIGFFLHIPFPTAKHFSTLSEKSSIIRGMMGADLIGFHTTQYADNFLESASSMTSATILKGGLAYRGRAIRVTDFPMGIDYIKFKEATKKASVQKEYAKLQKKYRGKKIILTVDRLDPTKGFIERLKAYQTFLKETPEMHGKVVMIMLAVPSRSEVDAYRKLKASVDELVEEINSTYGDKTWQPIDYMYQSVSFEYLNALYQIADVGFVAPIRDGMNLVAKEYVASQGDKKGMLILSRTAGASQELKDALLVNPEEPKTLVAALKKALNMPKKELRQRVSSMQDTLADNTVYDWAGDFMTTLKKPSLVRTPSLTALRTKNLIENYKSTSKRLLLLDYDGVLAPFVSDPKDAKPSKKLLDTIKRLAEEKENDVVIISGRSQDDLDDWLEHLPITLVAEHGAATKHPGKEWELAVKDSKLWIDEIHPLLEKYAFLAPGAFVEEKACSIVWHYRKAGPYTAGKQIGIMKKELKPLINKYGLKLYMGSKIVEIKSPDITKGHAANALLTKAYDFILALGDDFTDEDMFSALPRRAFTLKVGPGKTAARYRIADTNKVSALLKQM